MAGAADLERIARTGRCPQCGGRVVLVEEGEFRMFECSSAACAGRSEFGAWRLFVPSPRRASVGWFVGLLRATDPDRMRSGEPETERLRALGDAALEGGS